MSSLTSPLGDFPGGVHPGSTPGTDLRILATIDFQDEANRVAFAASALEQGLRDRRRREPVWLTCISYYLAKQWVEFDERTRRMVEYPAAESRVRYTENMFAPYVRHAIAQLLQNDPSIQVKPATADPDDWGVAKVGSKVARAWWAAKELKRESEAFLLWGKLTGNGFLKVSWDEFAGDYLAESDPEVVGGGAAVPPPGSNGTNGTGPAGGRLSEFFSQVGQQLLGKPAVAPNIVQAQDGQKFIRLGDVAFEAVSTFHVYADPAAESLRSARWVLDSRMRTLDWIRGRFPEKGKLVPEESARYKEGRRLADQVKNLYRGSDQMFDVPRALVTEVYIAPSPERPEGLWYTVAGNVALDAPRPLPTRLNGRPIIPFFQYRDKPIPGDFWATCVLEDGIAPQALRNRAISQQMEAANLCAGPIILNPSTSGLKKAQMSNTPGAIWNYTPSQGGLRPEFLPPPEYPAYAQNLVNTIRQGFENAVSMHEVSQGKAPPNTRTGVALAFLAEKDQNAMGQAAEELRAVWSAAMGCALELYADRVPDEPRLVKIAGQGSDDLDVLEFTGRDLRGQKSRLPGTNAFDAEVDFLPGLPKSRAAMQEQVFRAIEAGLINLQDPQERRLAWRWSGFAFPDDADTKREDEAQQHVELRILLQGDPATAQALANQVHPWDVHAAHVAVLDRFLKRPEALDLDPQRLGFLLAHRTLHQLALRAQLMPQMGAPGPGPAGAPPAPPPGPVGGTMFSPAPGPPNALAPQTAVSQQARTP